MLLIPLGAETLTILEAPFATSPRDGSKFRDWDNAIEHELTGCNVQAFIMSEKLSAGSDSDREFLKTAWRVWAPIGDYVPKYTDRAVWQGTTYELLSDGHVWRERLGPPHHIDFLLRLRAG